MEILINMADENLEQQTNQALDDLETFCSSDHIMVDSSLNSRLKSEQFKKVVSLGREALPFIYRRFKGKTIDEYHSSLVIFPLVKNIVGNDLPMPPKEIAEKSEGLEKWDVEGVYNYALRWLEENKYT